MPAEDLPTTDEFDGCAKGCGVLIAAAGAMVLVAALWGWVGIGAAILAGGGAVALAGFMESHAKRRRSQ